MTQSQFKKDWKDNIESPLEFPTRWYKRKVSGWWFVGCCLWVIGLFIYLIKI